MGVDIFVSTHDRQEVFKIPVLPPQIVLNTSSGEVIYETIAQGEINLPGLEKLNSMSWESHFPIDERSYSKNSEMFGWDYYNKLKQWQRDRMPIRIVVTDTPINELFTISSLNPAIGTGSGDVYYAITLTGFKFLELEKKNKE